jgi:hypothetical protein
MAYFPFKHFPGRAEEYQDKFRQDSGPQGGRVELEIFRTCSKSCNNSALNFCGVRTWNLPIYECLPTRTKKKFGAFSM